MSKKSEFDFNVFFTKFEIGDDQTLGRTCKVVDASTCILETALKPSAWLLFALGLKQNLSNKKNFKFQIFSSGFEKYRGEHFDGLNRVEGDCGGVWSHGRKSFWEGQWRIQGFDGEEKYSRFYEWCKNAKLSVISTSNIKFFRLISRSLKLNLICFIKSKTLIVRVAEVLSEKSYRERVINK